MKGRIVWMGKEGRRLKGKVIEIGKEGRESKGREGNGRRRAAREVVWERSGGESERK